MKTRFYVRCSTIITNTFLDTNSLPQHENPTFLCQGSGHPWRVNMHSA